MKTSLEIINKLSDKEAVKLDSQLVELGLIDDLNKLISTNKNAVSEANRFISNITITWNKLNSVLDDIDDMQSYVKSAPSAKNLLAYNNQEINKILTQMESQAKSLGLDAKSIKGYSEAKTTVEKNLTFIKDLEQSKTVGEKVLSQLKAS
jgi:hypothetical protein